MPGMQAHFRLAHDCMLTHVLLEIQETENKWDLVARKVVGAQICSYWAQGRLEVPEIKWVRTNNYKFHTFRLVHFHLSLSPRPSF